VDGLLDVNDNMIGIDHRLKTTVQSDVGVKKISLILKELLVSGELPEPKYND
jgi:hypothetical protein